MKIPHIFQLPDYNLASALRGKCGPSQWESLTVLHHGWHHMKIRVSQVNIGLTNSHRGQKFIIKLIYLPFAKLLKMLLCLSNFQIGNIKIKILKFNKNIIINNPLIKISDWILSMWTFLLRLLQYHNIEEWKWNMNEFMRRRGVH